MQRKYISVSGFSASGSSAVVDLLREYNNVYSCEAEIRIIWDPYGISQLERTLTDDWNMVSSSAAITDFLWLCNICARKGGGSFPLSRVGMDYNSKICKDFLLYVHEFIDAISDYTFSSDTYYQKFKKSYLRYVFDRCALGLEKVAGIPLYSKTGKRRISYFSHPTHEEFQRAAKNLFDNLFQSRTDQNEYILLDQAVSVNDPTAIHRYFNNGKLIIVDRDPRDMFVDDIVNWSSEKTGDYNTIEAGHNYVKKHKAMHEKISSIESEKILVVRFEDIVLFYDETQKRIEEFLGISPAAHEKKQQFLIPQKSSKNVGIWKKHYSKFDKAIDVINNELRPYCWE